MTRHVLQLPQRQDENDCKVELIIGKTVLVDGVNHHFFAGQIEEETIQGWGFTRYLVRKLGPMAGTLMARVPEGPMVEQFVRIGGEPYLIRYNSRLPVVVYVPVGTEVKYRIWHAGAALSNIDPG